MKREPSGHLRRRSPTLLFISSCSILLIWKFFTSALANGFPLEADWYQVSSNLQDSSPYSGRSQQWCSLGDLHSSTYFQVLQSHNQLQLLSLSLSFSIAFSVLQQVLGTYFSFRFLSVLPCGQPKQQSRQVLFCFCFIYIYIWQLLCLVVWPRLGDPFVSQNLKFMRLIIIISALLIFTQDLAWGKLVVICIECIYVFAASLRCYFYNHIDNTLLRRWAVPLRAILFISYSLELTGILLMYLSVPFLIISRCSHYYCHCGNFKEPHFFSFSFLVFELILFFDSLFSVGTAIYQLEDMFFFNSS